MTLPRPKQLLPRLVCFSCLAASGRGFATLPGLATRVPAPLFHDAQVLSNSRRRFYATRLSSYLAVHVFGQCKPGTEDVFHKHSLANARNSIMEPGVARFDLCQGEEDATEFCLFEVYKTDGAPAAHKATSHYAKWRDAVGPLMAKDRSARKYKTVFPPAALWGTEESAYADGLAPPERSLQAVLVDVEVKPGMEEAFRAATIDNARASMSEGGIHRFDVLVNEEQPTNFVLLEVYNNPHASAAHKATAHYAKWRETVEPMMARPRTAQKFRTRFPGRVHWHRSESVTQRSVVDLRQSFAFEAPEQILFGEGAAAQIGALIKKQQAHRPLVITGKSGKDRFAVVLGKLSAFEHYAVHDEPTIEDVREGLKVAKQGKCDIVIAIGGGSAIDAGKAIAAMMTNEGDVLDYVEMIGHGKPILHKAAPFIAVPTTSGTGSEVTKNAVVKSREHGVKVSVRSPLMMPSVALIDPLLTVSVPPHVTAHTGLDALCQNIEPFVSNKANPLVDAVAREGITRASRSLRAAYRFGGDLVAREDMALASVIGGLALANAKLGAVHGIAGIVGGMFEKAPHGAVCAALLPWVFRHNVKSLSKQVAALSEEQLNSHHGVPMCARSLARHVEVARMVTGNPYATAEEGAAWLEALVDDLDVPGLGAYGIKEEHLVKIVPLAADSSSMQGNPTKMTHDEIAAVIRQAL